MRCLWLLRSLTGPRPWKPRSLKTGLVPRLRLLTYCNFFNMIRNTSLLDPYLSHLAPEHFTKARHTLFLTENRASHFEERYLKFEGEKESGRKRNKKCKRNFFSFHDRSSTTVQTSKNSYFSTHKRNLSSCLHPYPPHSSHLSRDQIQESSSYNIFILNFLPEPLPKHVARIQNKSHCR